MRLRRAQNHDQDFVLTLRNLPEVVAMSRSKRRVTSRWYMTMSRWLKMIEVDGRSIGYLIITPVYEVSIALNPKDRGHGYGTVAMKSLGTDRLVARILPENEASVKMFRKAGFVEETTCRVFFKEAT